MALLGAQAGEEAGFFTARIARIAASGVTTAAAAATAIGRDNRGGRGSRDWVGARQPCRGQHEIRGIHDRFSFGTV
jgi:hypothetical protein